MYGDDGTPPPPGPRRRADRDRRRARRKPPSWAAAEITLLGHDPATFRPDDTVTRGELSELLTRAKAAPAPVAKPEVPLTMQDLDAGSSPRSGSSRRRRRSPTPRSGQASRLPSASARRSWPACWACGRPSGRERFARAPAEPAGLPRRDGVLGRATAPTAWGSSGASSSSSPIRRRRVSARLCAAGRPTR